MADRPIGMGRGLAAILAVGPRDEPEELRQLPIGLIEPNPRQPRRRFDEDGLLALAASMRIRGQIQPVLVRPEPTGRYELIAGERRWRAAKLAGFDHVLAMVRVHDDAAALEVALVENMVREDLNPVDEARACAALVEELGLTREEVGLRVGRGRVAVSNLLRLLDLPDSALELLESGALTEGHGRALLTVPDDPTRGLLAAQAATEGWSVRDVERRARAGASGAISVRRVRGLEDDPEERAAIDGIADALGEAFGTDVRVRASRGGYVAQLRFETPEQAHELASRLRIDRNP